MTRYARWLAAGGLALALAVWSLVLVANGTGFWKIRASSR